VLLFAPDRRVPDLSCKILASGPGLSTNKDLARREPPPKRDL